jgi:Uma2 family endonuclease
MHPRLHQEAGMAMLVAAIERPLTYEDLEGFPDDGKRREVVGGKLYVSPAPLKRHQRLSKRLVVVFHEGVELTVRGEVFHAPVDVRFPTGEQVRPDLIVLLTANAGRYRGHTVFGPPDIVVEFFSPGSQTYDRIEKAQLYAAHGVPEYWQADPNLPELTILELRNGRYVPVEPEPDGRLRSRLIPDLIVDPAALFANLDD